MGHVPAPDVCCCVTAPCVAKHQVRDRLRRGIDNEGAYQHLRVQGERVDDVVHEDVALMKMDVEGFEPHVLEVANATFQKVIRS